MSGHQCVGVGMLCGCGCGYGGLCGCGCECRCGFRCGVSVCLKVSGGMGVTMSMGRSVDMWGECG